MCADSILYFCDNLLLAGVSRELHLRLKTKWQIKIILLNPSFGVHMVEFFLGVFQYQIL